MTKKNLQNLIPKDVSSWREIYLLLVKEYKKTKNPVQLGQYFEEFCYYYFVFVERFPKVWLQKNIPDTIRNHLNLAQTDHGVDILLQDERGNFWAVQCKFKTKEESTLYWGKDKLAHLFAAGNKADFFIIMSNALRIDDLTAKSHPKRLQTLLNDRLSQLNSRDIGAISHGIHGLNMPQQTKKIRKKSNKSNKINFIVSIVLILEFLLFFVLNNYFFLFINILILTFFGTKKLLEKIDN